MHGKEPLGRFHLNNHQIVYQHIQSENILQTPTLIGKGDFCLTLDIEMPILKFHDQCLFID